MATRVQADGERNAFTCAVTVNPPLADEAGLEGLRQALAACREQMSHFRKVQCDNAAFNRWHRHARALEWAIGKLEAAD